MDRTQIIKVAELLNLNIKKNWKTEKILGMVDDKLASMNGEGPEEKDTVFKGLHPITGKPV